MSRLKLTVLGHRKVYSVRREADVVMTSVSSSHPSEGDVGGRGRRPCYAVDCFAGARAISATPTMIGAGMSREARLPGITEVLTS
jgi:hypothetical protein